MTHEIKCWPQYFSRVLDGSKTFEVRENDRGYQPGDIVKMLEWDPTIITKSDYTPYGDENYKEARGYSGQQVQFKIGYVLPIDDKRVVFSILNLESNTESNK